MPTATERTPLIGIWTGVAESAKRVVGDSDSGSGTVIIVPQHQRLVSARTAQEVVPPTATMVASVMREGMNEEELIKVPVPSWPRVLEPEHHTAASRRMHVCSEPEATEVMEGVTAKPGPSVAEFSADDELIAAKNNDPTKSEVAINSFMVDTEVVRLR